MEIISYTDVTARYRRKDRTIDDPESGNVPDPEFGVDHSRGVAIEGPHFAGSHRVVVGGGQVKDPAVPVLVRVLKRKIKTGSVHNLTNNCVP